MAHEYQDPEGVASTSDGPWPLGWTFSGRFPVGVWSSWIILSIFFLYINIASTCLRTTRCLTRCRLRRASPCSKQKLPLLLLHLLLLSLALSLEGAESRAPRTRAAGSVRRGRLHCEDSGPLPPALVRLRLLAGGAPARRGSSCVVQSSLRQTALKSVSTSSTMVSALACTASR